MSSRPDNDRGDMAGIDVAVTADTVGEALVLALKQAGYFLYKHVTYGEVQIVLKRVLAIREQLLGPHHPDVGTALHHLASLYRAQGFYDLAESLFHRELAIRERTLGPGHIDIVALLDHLALLACVQRKYDLAEHFKRSLAIS